MAGVGGLSRHLAVDGKVEVSVSVHGRRVGSGTGQHRGRRESEEARDGFVVRAAA